MVLKKQRLLLHIQRIQLNSIYRKKGVFYLRKSVIILISLFILAISSVAMANPVPYSFMSAADYKANQESVTLIDVRSPSSRSYSNVEIKGEIWINPYKTKPLEDFISTHDKNKSYAVYCSCTDDNYAIRAAQILTKRGFTNMAVIKGGLVALHNADVKLIPITKGNN